MDPAVRARFATRLNLPCQRRSICPGQRPERTREAFTVNSTHTLTFLWTPWSAAMSIAVVLLAAGFCWTAWRRSGYARSQGLLELLRLAIIALMALILNQPEWVEEFRPEEKPAIAVLWDNSNSMETRDVLRPSGGSALISRRE